MTLCSSLFLLYHPISCCPTSLNSITLYISVTHWHDYTYTHIIKLRHLNISISTSLLSDYCLPLPLSQSSISTPSTLRIHLFILLPHHTLPLSCFTLHIIPRYKSSLANTHNSFCPTFPQTYSAGLLVRMLLVASGRNTI